jgi:effector-binding domain-containing protein
VDFDVAVLVVPERPTAVIAEATTWQAWPQLWPALLDEVWREVRASAEVTPGRNVMLYRDDVPNVEVGVEVAEPFGGRLGRVTGSSLPAARVATTTLRGSYDLIGAAHEAVIRACDERGLDRPGVRWEVYGHWDERAPDPQVEIFWAVR